MKIFISYSHKDKNWVCHRLLPCVEAGGAEVLIDIRKFNVGRAVVGQMDKFQDQADKQLLVLSPGYLRSKYCRHEMRRAFKKDPKFSNSLVLPVLRRDYALPKAFRGWNPPVYADMRDDSVDQPWNALLAACKANRLDCSALAWLSARDNLLRYLRRKQSVNLVVQGKANWRGLLDHVIRDHLKDLACVDLQDPFTITRDSLLTTICRQIGERANLPQKPQDLMEFAKRVKARSTTKIAITHFDLAVYRRSDYDVDLFSTLRFLIMEERKLILLAQSRSPFETLLPKDHPLSEIEMKTVEL